MYVEPRAVGKEQGAASKTDEPKKKLVTVTLDLIVTKWLEDQRKTTHRGLQLGEMVEIWLRAQPDRPANEKLDRASALKVIRSRLIAAGVERRSCRVDRYLRCYEASRLFGGDVESLSISAIREVLPLIERDKASGKYRIVPTHAEAARALWARMLAEKISADAVRSAVQKILPPKSIALRKHRPVKVGFVLKLLPRLPAADLATLIARAQELAAQTLLPSDKVA
jgi:hypothetical protein